MSKIPEDWKNLIPKSPQEGQNAKYLKKMINTAWNIAKIKYDLYDSDEEYLRVRLQNSKSQSLKQIQDSETKNIPDLGSKEELLQANELRNTLDIKPDLQFYFNLMYRFGKKTDHSPTDLNNLIKIFKEGIKIYPYELPLWSFLVKLYQENLNFKDIIELCAELNDKLDFDGTEIRYLDEDKVVSFEDLSIFNTYLVDAFEATGQYELALYICQNIEGYLSVSNPKTKRYLLELGRYEELIDTINQQKNDLKTPITSKESNSNSIQLENEFVVENLRDIKWDLDILFFKTKNVQDLDHLRQDYFKLANRFIEFNNLLKIKKVSSFYSYKLNPLKLSLAYVAIIFDQFQQALDLYNSIDSKQYLDLNDSDNNDQNIKQKDYSESLNRIMKLLTLNAEGKSPYLNIELGKIICYFKMHDLDKAYVSLKNLVNIFNQDRSKIGNFGKTASASNFINYSRFDLLESHFTKLKKSRDDYFALKIDHSKYRIVLNEFVDFVEQNYLDRFKETLQDF